VTEVAIHPAAEAEYEDALRWYLDRSSQAADRFEAAFGEAIEAIRSHSSMFPRCDEVQL
jgi:plasmid stabilization system protein ParE